MNDKFLNNTGLSYYHNRVKTLFADKTEVQDVADDLATLSDRVDDIVAEGGEPNVIETVKVNNTALTPDANKAVNIDLSDYAETSDVPTKTSDLTNDGDGTSNFATESYVDTNGGKIDKIKVNGTAQTITNKEVDITVPTKTSDLTNDNEFITKVVNDLTNYYKKSETYTQSEVDSLISAAKTGRFVPVQTLPTTNIDTTVIYLVPKSDGETGDVKDEYINIDGTTSGWEKIGSTNIDLSNYWNSTNLVAITTSEIDTIVAGS